MESVYCNCKKCDTTIGLFINLWTRIGKSYYSPIVDPDGELAVRPDGDTRIGETDTLVEECHLQDIVCFDCSAVVGLKCVETPVNHVLDENQVLLRLASVELLSRDGQEVEFKTKRVLDVKEPSKVNTNRFTDLPNGSGFNASTFPQFVDLVQLQADLDGQRQDIDRIDNEGFEAVAALDKRVNRIDVTVTKFTDALSNHRRDLVGVQKSITSFKTELGQTKQASQDAVVAGLEEKLNATDGALTEVRRDFGTLEGRLRKELSSLRTEIRQCKQGIEELKADVRDRVSTHDHAQDMAALRNEMAQMRRQMDEMRSRGADRAAAPFPSKELDILTSNISNIRNRASQVETLQMEFEILKGRVERVEAASRQSPDDRIVAHPIGQDSMASYSDGLPSQRKRASSGIGITPMTHQASKRTAYASNFSQSSSHIYDVPDEWVTPESIRTDQKVLDEGEDGARAVKLTRSGKVDKRSLRVKKSTNGKKS
ncbi:hypothetical protein OQA88_6805 [Cercophora sp. LCS_1]